MENESMTLPRSVLEKYKNALPDPMFIETGTWDGRTVQMALDSGFSKVASIETDPTLCKMATERFFENDKVRIQHGESEFWLDIICKTLDNPAVFWLDAHIQEHYKGGTVIVPLMEELEILARHAKCLSGSADFPIMKSVIMIDDMRCVGNAYGWEHISKEGIMTALLKINKDFTIVYEDSKAAARDIMVAYPRGLFNA